MESRLKMKTVISIGRTMRIVMQLDLSKFANWILSC